MSLSSPTKAMASEEKSGGFHFSKIWDKFGMLMVFAGLFLLCALFVPYFATFINMKGLGLAISMSGMVACAMLFCLACGDLDLSVASIIACSGVVTAVAINATSSVVLGIGAGLLSGGIWSAKRLRYRQTANQRADHDSGNDANCPWSRLYHL